MATPDLDAQVSAMALSWESLELDHLEDAVDNALRAEVVDEPESEDLSEPDALEAALGRAQCEVMRQLVAPIMECSSGPEAENENAALKELAVFVDKLLEVIRKTWRLAHLRGRQTKVLGERAALDEAARGGSGEGGVAQGEKVQDVLEGTMSKLTATRKSLKEKTWELAEARNKIDQLERDKTSQVQKIRQMDTVVVRESWARIEAERRISDAKSEADAEAEQQRGDLRRRLSTAEIALDEAQTELGSAETRSEEARQRADSRSIDLESQLTESRRMIEVLEQRLVEATVAKEESLEEPAPNVGLLFTPPRRAQNLEEDLCAPESVPTDGTASGSRSKQQRRKSAGDEQSSRPQREPNRQERMSLPPRMSLPLETVSEEDSGALGEASLPRSGSRGGGPMVPLLRGLGSLPQTGLADYPDPEPTPPREPPERPQGGTPERTSGKLAGTAVSSRSGPKASPNAKPLPMDLRALGKLLTGGGVTPRHGARKSDHRHNSGGANAASRR